jgi:hypothetical protein
MPFYNLPDCSQIFFCRTDGIKLVGNDKKKHKGNNYNNQTTASDLIIYNLCHVQAWFRVCLRVNRKS